MVALIIDFPALCSGTLSEQMRAAKLIKCPPELLTRFVTDPKFASRIGPKQVALANRNLPEGVLVAELAIAVRSFLDKRGPLNSRTLAAVLSNPKLTEAQLAATAEQVGFPLAALPQHEALMFAEIGAALFSHKNCPESLMWWALDVPVARKPSGHPSPSVTENLSNLAAAGVGFIAVNPSIPADIAYRLLRRRDAATRRLTAKNKSVPVALLEGMPKENSITVLRVLIQRLTGAPQAEALQRLERRSDGSTLTLRMLNAQYSSDPATITMGCTDSDRRVRRVAIQNAHATDNDKVMAALLG